jgi:hypothetical protein
MPESRPTIIRRIAWRPFRWFLGIWLALSLAWLLSGSCGLQWHRAASNAPDPRAVPYHEFLPGGSRHDEAFDFNPDPAALPMYDATFDTGEYFYFYWLNTAKGPRLIAAQNAGNWTFGWPTAWIWSARTHWFDVTEPDAGFEPARFPMEVHPLVQSRGQLVWWTWFINGRTGLISLSFDWGRLIAVLIALEAAAGLLVLATWVGLGAVWRRRWREGRCPNCGYDLRGAREITCSECGDSGASTYAVWRAAMTPESVVRPGRWVAGWSALLLVAWLGMAVVSGRQELQASLETELALFQRIVETEGVINNAPAERRSLLTRMRTYGWPLPLLEIRDHQMWEFAPGREPVTAPMNRRPGFHYDSDSAWWTHRGPDPTRRRDIDLYWRTALLELGGLHMVSMLLAGLAIVIAGRCRPH